MTGDATAASTGVGVASLPAGVDPAILRDRARRQLARKYLLDFVRYTKPTYRARRVHEFVAERLQAFVDAVERGESPRLMLFMPPQEGKSELVSRKLPAWVLGNHPDWRVILVSYGAELAEAMSRSARLCVESEAYQQLFPSAKLDPTSTAASDWSLAGQDGGMLARGVGGGITGQSAELLIVDDPVKGRNEVDRDAYRDEQWAWWPQADDRVQEGGGIIVLCTRWHHDDLPGRLLKQAAENPEAPQWEVIKLRAIAGEDDPLGRGVGEGLGGRHSLKWFGSTKASIPERDWTAKFEQEPTADGGNIFKEEWFRFEDAPAHVTGHVFQCADTAFSEKKRAAYTCVETWRIEPNCVRLLHVYRQRVGFPNLNEDIRELARTFAPMAIVIEDKASGMSLIQVLHKETLLPVLPWQPKGDKATRAHAVTPMFKSGRVVLPKSENAPWLKAWLKEHLEFPASEFRDQVDTTSQALLWVQEQGWRLEEPVTEMATVDFTYDADRREDTEVLDMLAEVSGARRLHAEAERVVQQRLRADREVARVA